MALKPETANHWTDASQIIPVPASSSITTVGVVTQEPSLAVKEAPIVVTYSERGTTDMSKTFKGGATIGEVDIEFTFEMDWGMGEPDWQSIVVTRVDLDDLARVLKEENRDQMVYEANDVMCAEYERKTGMRYEDRRGI